MDTDTRAMTDALNQALADSGLSAAEFAAALGTSASRFSTYRSGKTAPAAPLFLRALRFGAAMKDAREHGWMTPSLTIGAIRDALGEGTDRDEEAAGLWAYKMALQARDHLHDMLRMRPSAAASWEAVPTSTGFAEWDTLLAALTAHEFASSGQTAPGWTEGYYLEEEWLLDNPLYTEDQIRSLTPGWLAERGIFIAERDLTTA